jgi:hypothetical protein
MTDPEIYRMFSILVRNQGYQLQLSALSMPTKKDLELAYESGQKLIEYADSIEEKVQEYYANTTTGCDEETCEE